MLAHHNNKNFTTRDRDNDQHVRVNCGSLYGKGGWWFGKCHSTCPTGVYYNLPEAVNTSAYARGVIWRSLNGKAKPHHYSLKYFEAKIFVNLNHVTRN